MKKYLSLVILISVLTLLLIPSNLLNAQPTELVTNGDFELGLSDWQFSTTGDGGAYSESEGGGANNYVKINSVSGDNNCRQIIFSIPSPDLTFSYKVRSNINTYFNQYYVKIALYNGSTELGFLIDESNESITSWTEVTHDVLSELQIKYPSVDFSTTGKVKIYFGVNHTDAQPASSDFDDLSLTYEEKSISTVKTESKPAWVRPMPMTCWQVWINEDNDFQFIFWYPYKDKNWVRIYDMEDNMVFEVDVPEYDPNLIVDLPDGMYTVKTYP